MIKLLENINDWIIGQYKNECKIRWAMEDIKEREQKTNRKVVIFTPYELSEETKNTSSIDADLAARIAVKELFEKQIEFFGSNFFLWTLILGSLTTFAIFVITKF